MKLKILNSNSQGNAYILQSTKGEALLIECGVRIDLIMQAMKFKLKDVAGCIITHSHGDHCKSVTDVIYRGIQVYASAGELKAMGVDDHHNAHPLLIGSIRRVGSFLVKPFRVIHDTPEPVGYLVKHDECGLVLFLTDTVYSPFTFSGLNNIIVEANYCEDIIEAKLQEHGKKFYRDRVIQSHMSIQNCKDLLKANDLTKVNNIVLIHLSDGNSSEPSFKKQVQELTGKNVHVANKGMEIDFNKSAF